MKQLLFFVCLSFLVEGQIPEGKKVISALYVYDLTTSESSLIVKEKRHFEAPNWSRDGKFLLINCLGHLEKIDLNGKILGVLNTGEIQKSNNDHGYSFDGQTLFISSGKKEIETHTSFIYKVTATGGDPIQITPKTPSYWHGVSPDGKDIVYCAERKGIYDVYKMSSSGGKEIRLTNSKSLDDGPEYSPDGKYIYFNSYRTGRMQIWRMKPDGSEKEQMTFDAYSNWFAHISPNNDTAVLISYLLDQKQKHPFGRMVKLRLINFKSKKIKDLTLPFYGGQGTMNVSSWSPDGTKFAYVKYGLKDIIK
ncbi:MAG: TolB protein [Flavobacteriaceae bacterium]|jgi:TolB protein|tara:strand:- start:230 stop:1150 length:921 start_codon:yes stop_codon:yes gene_type:complete